MTVVPYIEPLRWSFPPRPREPANGYASRLAALNGGDLNTLMRGVGVSVRKLHTGDDVAVRNVAALGGLDTSKMEPLRHYTPRRFGPADSTIGDEKLSWRSLLTGYCRFCPHCVAEDLTEGPADVPVAARPWLRVEWMIDQVRSCPKHGIRLFETNPVTAAPAILDFSAAIRMEVLPGLERMCDEAEPAEPNVFEEWILRRLDGVRDPEDWLDRMPMYAAVDVCEAIGFETLDMGGPVFSQLGMMEKAAASLAGHRMVRSGEAAINRFLDSLVSRGHEAGYVGSEKISGYIWRTLERTLNDPAFDEFRDIVRRHALDNVPFAAGTMVLGQVLEKRRLHTATSASAESKTCHQTMRALFERTGIAPAPNGSDRKRLTFRVDEFEDLLREYGTALNVSEIRESTGIIHTHVLELISRGVIPALFGSRDVTRARHRIAVGDIESFMERLFRGAITVETPTHRQVTLGRACLVASTNIGDLVSLILAGGLAWKGRLRGGRLYTDLLIDADELMMILQKDKTPRQSMTKGEIRAEMEGMSLKVANAMIAAGHLEVVKEFCPTARRQLPLVTRESFEAFRARYVTLDEIGQPRGMHWRVVRRTLASAGCLPAYIWDERGYAIYERTEALDAAMAPFPLTNRPVNRFSVHQTE